MVSSDGSKAFGKCASFALDTVKTSMGPNSDGARGWGRATDPGPPVACWRKREENADAPGTEHGGKSPVTGASVPADRV